MDRLDFDVILSGGRPLKRSQMSDEQWAVIYPVERLMINGRVIPLMAPDVEDIFVSFGGGQIRVKVYDWDPCRFFCFNNGRAFYGTGTNEWYATTFGVMYPNQQLLCMQQFDDKGRVTPIREGYSHADSIV